MNLLKRGIEGKKLCLEWKSDYEKIEIDYINIPFYHIIYKNMVGLCRQFRLNGRQATFTNMHVSNHLPKSMSLA